MIQTIGQQVTSLRQAPGYPTPCRLPHQYGPAHPTERTVILLARIFKHTPLELVEGTAVPLAKAQQLAETEQPLALFSNISGDSGAPMSPIATPV